uniref:Major facilitator superfamily (MFS) profile domain-containing protein n=1 Tax=Branchiostoma floridae TaxID=7739 RepID=C3YBT9_BRAFL|eukprot:XP_002606436.1 hypothetical protein BRAFLDRAFT_67688 [Branchiostoma floridae]
MIDCKLVTLKIYYFLFFGGIACFVPYISVYLRQLGLLPYQAGIISGTYPFFTFLLKPILGAAADKFDRHKQIHMLCLFLTYCLMFCTMFVPPVNRGQLQIGNDCISTGLSELFGIASRRSHHAETKEQPLRLRQTAVVGCDHLEVSSRFGSRFQQPIPAADSSYIAFGFEKWRQKRPEKMLQSLRKLLGKPNELLFLAVMFTIGSSFGAKANFLFWYLKDMGASQLLLGLAMMINCMAEIPFMFFSGHLIRKIGHKQVFQLALLCYTIKFFSYSLIPSAWWVLAIEPLHGITFGAMYATAITYTSLIAPPGMETTMQGIVGAVHFGVGFASGALIGGAIFNAFGGVVLFRVYAVVCLVSCILYRLIPRFLRNSKGEEASPGPQHGESEETHPVAEGQDETRTETCSKSYETIYENANVSYYETSV